MNRALIRKVMQAMGRNGGRIGGKISAERMSRTERIARAKKAASASAKVRSAKARTRRKRKVEE